MAVQQVTPLTCANCRTQYNAPVETIVNGQDPAMKGALIQGYLNLSQCPRCGAVNSANLPVLFYDLEKELAFIYAPSSLMVGGVTQEKMIGDLTNRVFNNLPQEQRKFYLLNPKQFLTMESLVKAVLEADGITEEMLEQQAARSRLIEEFLTAPDEATLKEKIKEHDDKLDYDFFEMLTAFIQTAQLQGDTERAQTFFALRRFLSKFSTQGKQAVAEIDQKIGLVVLENQDELLDRLLEAKSAQEFESLVAGGHSLLDYAFFQKLTGKIDEADKKGDQKTAETLRSLRQNVLDMKAQHEEASRQALERAGEIFKEILQSDRPDRVIEKRLKEIDEAFFFILNANIEEARRRGQQEVVQALDLIGNLAMARLQGIDLTKVAPAEEQSEETPAADTAGEDPAQEQPPAPQPQILIAKR